MDVAQLLVIHRRGRVHHQVHRLLRLREGNDVADAVASGQQHHEPVRADGEAAVRRRAVFQRADQMAETALDFGLGQALDLEHPRLEFRVVDADAAAAEFGAVEHDVISLRAHVLGIAVEQRHVFRPGGRERMVHADQPAFVVAFHQREIRHPCELEHAVRDHLGLRAREQADAAQDGQHLLGLVGAEEDQIAGLDVQCGLQAGLFGVGEEFDNGRFPGAVLLDADIGQAAEAAFLGQPRPVLLHHLDGRVGETLGVDGLHHAAVFQRAGKHLELRALENAGEVDDLHAEAEVGLVAAVAVHGFAPGHARQRQRRHRMARGLHQAHDQAVDDGDDVFGGHERHLDVDLGEFRLAVGAQVLVAEAAGDLDVAVHAGHHQQLLVLLRGLREGEEHARAHAAGHEIVARAFRRALGQDRRFDLDELLLVEIVPGRLDQAVAQHERLLHRRPAQIEIAEFQAQVLADVLGVAVVQRERRRVGLVQHRDAGGAHLDAAGGDMAVDHVRRTLAHFARELHDEFTAAGLRGIPGRLGILGIEHALGQPVTVAQIDENQPAVVAHAVDPAAQFHLRARVGRPQLSACMCPHLHVHILF